MKDYHYQFLTHIIAYYLWPLWRNAKPSRYRKSEQDFDIETDRREGW